jgi:large subunit ribosomal protein L9
VDRLKEDGITITRKQLLLAAPIKDLGKHTVGIKLHADLQVKLNIEVVSENPIEEDGE